SPGLVSSEAHDLFWHDDRSGYQLTLSYLRNIKWLQLGGAIEYGRFDPADERKIYTDNKGISFYERRIVADPYWTVSLLGNYRFSLRKWSFYAGLAAGHIFRRGGAEFRTSGNSQLSDQTYTVNGLILGAQAGIVYSLSQRIAISADFMARNSYFDRGIYIPLSNEPNGANPYDRLRLHNFGIGVHYRF
ncbi:MAG: hypothetical protein K0R82_1612, partial [Flavipsychrobacter sp.]|nr:hypothetical protein [Flavipsychrobacter sp.]